MAQLLIPVLMDMMPIRSKADERRWLRRRDERPRWDVRQGRYHLYQYGRCFRRGKTGWQGDQDGERCPYYLEGTTDKTLKNYNIEIEKGNATINKAALYLSTGDYTEEYGDAKAVQHDLDTGTTVTGKANGDDLKDLISQIGIKNTSPALLNENQTNDVKYKTDGSLDSYGITTDFKNSLDNYDVSLDKKGNCDIEAKGHQDHE